MEKPPVIIGPTYGTKEPTQGKIFAADGLAGVMILMAYWAGGHNLFPRNLTPQMYLTDEKLEGRCVETDLRCVAELIRNLSTTLGVEFGTIGQGSVPIYLSALRNGNRANGQGNFPAVKVEYEKKTGKMIIHPRFYLQDKAEEIDHLIPSWVRDLQRFGNE